MKKLLPALIFSLLLFPLVVQAWSCYNPGICDTPDSHNDCYFFCEPSLGAYRPNSFMICCFIDHVGEWLQMLGWGLAVIAVVIGGIMYMTAGGNEDRVGKAKKIVMNGLIGAVIIFLAGIIIQTLVELLSGV